MAHTTKHKLIRPSATRIAAVAGLSLTAVGGVSADNPGFPNLWWNPGGSPESGSFSNSANWYDFCRPSTSDSAANSLQFCFDTPAPFTADNDLKSGLRAAHLFVCDAPQARITGMPIRLVGEGLISKYSPSSTWTDSEALIIEAPLQGTAGAIIEFGMVEFNPPGGQHTLTGGIRHTGGMFTVPTASKLGALSNTYTLAGGTFYARTPLNIAIPFIFEQGTINTANADETTSLLLPIEGDGTVTKIGPGTLSLNGSNTSAAVYMTISEGTLRAATNALGTGTIHLLSGTTLDLTGSNQTGLIRGPGEVLLNGHTLTIAPASSAYTLAGMTGTGTLRIDGPGLVYLGPVGSLDGELEVFEGHLSCNLPVTTESDVIIHDDGQLSINNALTVDTLTGAGVLTLNGTGTGLTFTSTPGHDTFEGRVEGTEGSYLEKRGAQHYMLTGMNDFCGEIRVTEGSMGALRESLTNCTSIHLASGTTFNAPGGIVAARRITGDGTLTVSGSGHLTFGELNDNWTFDGVLMGSASATLRKRGSGRWTLTNGSHAFAGFLDVLGGTLALAFEDHLTVNYLYVNGNSRLEGRGILPNEIFNQGEFVANDPTAPLVIDASGSRGSSSRMNHGTMTAEAGATLEIRSASIAQDTLGTIRADGGTVRFAGSSVTIMGGTAEAIGDGVLDLAAESVIFSAAQMTGSTAFASDTTLHLDDSQFTTSEASETTVSLDSTPRGPFIQGAGSLSLDGSIRILHAPGYAPAAGTRVVIADRSTHPGLSITGSFASVIAPDISPMTWKAVSDEETAVLLAHCPGDTSGDGLVNFTDLEQLLESWNTSVFPLSSGDLNADGSVNFTDLELLLESWGSTCQ